MEKTDVVASLGESPLLRPAYLKAALAANDRLKFYLTTLQTAYNHAAQPEVTSLDLHREYAAAGVDAPALSHRVATALQYAFGLRVSVCSVPAGTLPRFEAKSKRWIYR